MDGGREYMGKLCTFPSICCELQIALKELSLLKKRQRQSLPARVIVKIKSVNINTVP